MKKLKASASDFIVDESDNRLYAIGSKINVFDLTTLKKIGSVSGFHYLTAACLVRKHGIMFVATNNDECWTVSLGDYTKIKRFRVRLHDSDVYYDESEDKVYIVGYDWKNCRTEAAVYDCEKDEMRSLRFAQCEEDGEVVWYSLNKCIDGYLYLFKRTHNVHGGRYVHDITSLFGRYRVFGDEIRIAETIYKKYVAEGYVDTYSRGCDDYMCGSDSVYRVQENDVVDIDVEKVFDDTCLFRVYRYGEDVYLRFAHSIYKTTRKFDMFTKIYETPRKNPSEKDLRFFRIGVLGYFESSAYRFIGLNNAEVLVFDKNEEMKSSAICMKGR